MTEAEKQKMGAEAQKRETEEQKKEAEAQKTEEQKTEKRILGYMKKPKFALKKSNWIGIIAAAVIILIALALLLATEWFDANTLYFILGISVIIAALPFFANFLIESKKESDKEEMFLEFSRDLVEGVRSGTSISKSILNMKTKNYGSLNPHIEKLANQIALGIPVKASLENFSREVNNPVISRAITLISEAERAGGRIETILESVASSVGQIEKLRKERKAAIYNLTVQGYIIFFIFIAIMLIMQYKILPITGELGAAGALLGGSGMGGGLNLGGDAGGVNLESTGSISIEEMTSSFLYLLIVQGFFAGLVIGKISEGSVKAGLKHSFILVAVAMLVALGARAFLG